MISQKNVLGTDLKPCCMDPLTGFYRTGSCHVGPEDRGVHAVCIEVTQDFLAFSQSVGNDLSTPNVDYDFKGLQPGDRWCLCASRFAQALQAGVAPLIYLESTHESALAYATLDELKRHALDGDIDELFNMLPITQ